MNMNVYNTYILYCKAVWPLFWKKVGGLSNYMYLPTAAA